MGFWGKCLQVVLCHYGARQESFAVDHVFRMTLFEAETTYCNYTFETVCTLTCK